MRKKTNKNTVRRSVVALVAMPIFIIAFFVLLNLLVDPLHQFHRNWFKYYWSELRYVLPGLAKHSQAETLIAGASTSYYFSEEVERFLGGTSLNLSVPGGTLKEQRLLLELAISHSHPKRVIWGVEWFSAGFDSEAVRIVNFPYHLYGPSFQLINSYLLDPHITGLSLKIAAAWSGSFVSSDLTPQREFFSRWASFNQAGANRVEAAYISRQNRHVEAKLMAENMPGNISGVKNNLERNILEIIRNNGDIDFIIFLPPHSIAGQLYLYLYFPVLWDNLRSMREFIIDRVGSHGNVRVFDFQINPSLNQDFHSFSDLRHFSKPVGEKLLTAIAAGQERAAPGSANERWNQLLGQVKDFEKNCGFCDPSK